MERNYLYGTIGDELNALLAGCGRNLRKLLQILFYFFSVDSIFAETNLKSA